MFRVNMLNFDELSKDGNGWNKDFNSHYNLFDMVTSNLQALVAVAAACLYSGDKLFY